MSFVFGWYTFTYKTYTAADLQLDEEKWGNAEFEIRQMVFHLFWIPFFSLGKKYRVAVEGKYFEAPPLIEGKLMNKNSRSPWYAYFIPVALIVGFAVGGIFMLLSQYWFKYKRHAREETSYEISITDAQHKLENLKLNAYLRLKNRSEPTRTEQYYLKYVNKKNNNYQFLLYLVEIPHSRKEEYRWIELTHDTVTVTKDVLKNAICEDYELYKSGTCGEVFLKNNSLYAIDQIDFFDGPVIDGPINRDFFNIIRDREFTYNAAGLNRDQAWDFKLVFQNFGSKVDLVKIENIKNNVKWIDRLPYTLDTYTYYGGIIVKGTIPANASTMDYQSKFIFQDSLNNKYAYLVSGNSFKYKIERIK